MKPLLSQSETERPAGFPDQAPTENVIGAGSTRQPASSSHTKPVLIDLAHGLQTVVSESDMIAIRALHASFYRGTNGYVYYSKWRDGRSWPDTLHAFLIGPVPKGSHIDHINGDKLDNRRENLRVVTNQRNQVNRKRLNKNNTSGVRGVAHVPALSSAKPWRAQITVNRKNLYLGLFATKAEAAAVRRSAELEHFGEWCP